MSPLHRISYTYDMVWFLRSLQESRNLWGCVSRKLDDGMDKEDEVILK